MRYAFTLGILLALATPATAATTYYVDGNCPGTSPTDGNKGKGTACGVGGPMKTIVDGIALLSAPGDHLQIRGAHLAHDGETGSFTGAYYGTGEYRVANKTGTALANIFIEPYLYGTANQETVYVVGGTAVSWSPCSAVGCTSGVCTGVPAGVCDQTWYTSSPYEGGIDGTFVPTYRVTSIGNLAPPAGTNRYHSYAGGSNLFVRWGSSVPVGVSVMPSSGGYAFTIRDNSAFITLQGLRILNWRTNTAEVSRGANNIVIRDSMHGYVMQSGGGSDRPVTVYRSDEVSIEDNEFFCSGSEAIHVEACGMAGAPVACQVYIRRNWIHDLGGNCSAFGPATIGATPNAMTLADSTDSLCVTPVDPGACSNLPGGWQTTATPNCRSDSDCSGGKKCCSVPGGGGIGAGDYTGSEVLGNLFERISQNQWGGSGAYGVRIENNSYGWLIKDNIFRDIAGPLITNVTGCGNAAGNPNCATNSTSGNVFVGNILQGNSTKVGLEIGADAATHTSSTNKVYNNTFINNSPAIGMYSGALGSMTLNEFRNNIIYDTRPSSFGLLVNFPPTGNTFENNSVSYARSYAGPIAAFGGATASCDTPTVIGPGNICPGALWTGGAIPGEVEAGDFRTHPWFPTIDAGTMGGANCGDPGAMPCRTGINNTVNGGHCRVTGTACKTTSNCVQLDCLPPDCVVNDCIDQSIYSSPTAATISSLPDMGAYESFFGDGGFETGTLDGPGWYVPLGDWNSTCTAANYVTAPTALSGARSMAVSSGPCLESLCSNCRGSAVYRTITGLIPGRYYTLSGKWNTISGTPGATARINFGFHSTSPCPAGSVCLAEATCVALVVGQTRFICPSFLVPEASTMTMSIVPYNGADAGSWSVAIDDLELR